MLQIHSDLQELLTSLCDGQQPQTISTYQQAYIRFRGLVIAATEENEMYQQWAQQWLVDVHDETGEVVKLHQTAEELKADIHAFIKLIERNEHY